MRLNQGYARVAASALLFRAMTARADLPPETRQACHRGYEQGQRLRRAGHLLDARKELLVCARDPCPSVFQPECVAWLAEVDHVLPSVVLDVRQHDIPRTDAHLWLDGRALPDRPDGREMLVDPGEHMFRVEVAGFAPIEKRELLVEGDKAHRVVVDVSPPRVVSATLAPPVTPAVARPAPWVAVAASGVGALALGSFAYFGATGLARRNDVLNQCLQHCQPSDIDFVRQHFTVADISLAVSVVALSVATYAWIRWAGSGPSTVAATHPFIWTF